MANVIINDTNLYNIANAIRQKNGSTDKYLPSQMADAITAISTSGSDTENGTNQITFTGDCSYLLSSPFWHDYINDSSVSVSSKDITDMEHFLHIYSPYTLLPFTINFAENARINMTKAFYSNSNLESLPNINWNGAYSLYMSNCFSSCLRVKNIDETFFNGADKSKFKDVNCKEMFAYMKSLRTISPEFLSYFKNFNVSSSNKDQSIYYAFKSNYSLDEIVALPVINSNGVKLLPNYSYGIYLFRIKNFIFEVQSDGSPIQTDWNGVVLDLSSVGTWGENMQFEVYEYLANGVLITRQNYSTTYNNPDSYTLDGYCSRYNHDSAVNTINSLPDCSASGGSNTVKFKGYSGTYSPGGAISKLTETEIAVATAKGWTVSIT